jgi:hypothetical protein
MIIVLHLSTNLIVSLYDRVVVRYRDIHYYDEYTNHYMNTNNSLDGASLNHGSSPMDVVDNTVPVNHVLCLLSMLPFLFSAPPYPSSYIHAHNNKDVCMAGWETPI